MLEYLHRHNLITSQQHGFLSKHSTCTQLLECVNDWSLALRNHHVTDVVYFDFAKAFDTVSHTKLILKLSGYGICGPLLDLLTNFLSGRSQRVVLPCGSSGFNAVISGVPQGSVLGPLLFLLFINDNTDCFINNVAIKLFADDVKVYMEIVNQSDTAIFQNSIDCISNWASTWQLCLAPNKCMHMRVSLNKPADCNVQYLLNGNVLSCVAQCRDLGVQISSHLSFNDHIYSIVSKAHIRASQILRCFVSRDPATLIFAFNTLCSSFSGI